MTAENPPLLTETLLRALEERLLGLGVPLEEWTNPGLTPEEVAKICGPAGVALPAEAVTWWCWRNGAVDLGQQHLLPGGRRFASLTDAIFQYQEARDVAVGGARHHPHHDPDRIWPPEWFPLDKEPQHLVVDCSVAYGEPTPIRRHSFEAELSESAVVRARSFGELVSWWCSAIDGGGWSVNAAGEWVVDADRLDPAFRASDLL